jgi:hypothetical protein
MVEDVLLNKCFVSIDVVTGNTSHSHLGSELSVT